MCLRALQRCFDEYKGWGWQMPGPSAVKNFKCLDGKDLSSRNPKVTASCPSSSKLLNVKKLFLLLLLTVVLPGAWLGWALLLPVTPAGQKFVLLRPGYST